MENSYTTTQILGTLDFKINEFILQSNLQPSGGGVVKMTDSDTRYYTW